MSINRRLVNLEKRLNKSTQLRVFHIEPTETYGDIITNYKAITDNGATELSKEAHIELSKNKNIEVINVVWSSNLKFAETL